MIKYQEIPVQIMSTKQSVVGKYSFHNGNFEIRGVRRIKIGSFCAIGKDVKLITSNHDYRYPVLQYGFYKIFFGERPIKDNDIGAEFSIEIGSDVWIGDNVCILPDVKIGNGVVIGTGSIVTKDIPHYAIVAGVPAKVIKNRFSDSTIDMLLESQWWDWSDERISQERDFFFKKLL
ncbi:CatB-related O-acetyltransferase [Flavobacterium suncheonense]|uniref:CatB-related O-acetyltransferase n=1 Tax=Flavobacterium suncheonense TaxID=350894 RepID=UPI003FA389D7